MKLKNKNNVEIITSWDDFRDEDEKLFNLLCEYNIPAIFYIPYKEILKPKKLELAKRVAKRFEIGSHTINHPVLTEIPKPEMYAEIIDSKSLLEEALDIKIKSFCYPKGRYNDKVINILKKVGYVNARTVDVGCIDYPVNPFKTKTTVHAYNRREYKGLPWELYARKKIDIVFRDGGYFHLWGHAWEINKYGDWNKLEYIFKYLNKKIND